MTILMEQEIESDIPAQFKDSITDVIEEVIRTENCPYSCEVNITFTDNNGIREINREYREMDLPTDVLSFPMVPYEKPADFTILEDEMIKISSFNPETKELLLGDIIISLERAQEQAEEYGHSLKREICFLVAHSMLHLFGYDHMEEDERNVMEQKQRDVLDALNISRD